MARKSFLLRMDPGLLAALQQWAADDLRSLNGQIEYLLKQAVLKRGMKVPEDQSTVAGEKDQT
ncbi:MAG TPA: hypothetical protein PLX97_14795, partial [Gemmatales bacterium]|nr:hypothetical protein [Gemmatales bacterium]